MSKRDAYIQKLKLQLDGLNLKMNELDVRAQGVKAEARDMYNAEMLKVHQQSALAITRLDEIRIAGENSWEAMVAEMEKVHNAFVRSFHYFKSQL